MRIYFFVETALAAVKGNAILNTFPSVLINRLTIDSVFTALEKTQAELFDLKTKYDEESTAKYVSISG